MYLHTLKLWNFRKYSTSNGSKEITRTNEGLKVEFNETLNVLIGENDSGKTAIIDSIKYVLKTKSLDAFWLDDRDFYQGINGIRRDQLKIECVFKGITDSEAGSFIEWIGFDIDKNFELKVWLIANRKNQSIYTKLKAGHDDEGIQLDGEARENLKTIYLKPLRDALGELTPGFRSRLAQILKGHEIFKDKKDAEGNRIEHKLEEKVKIANSQVSSYFDINKDENNPEYEGKKITNEIKSYLDAFSFEDIKNSPEFFMSKGELNEILKKLSLVMEDNKSGLGTLNKLYMAAEFLLLNQSNNRGLKLALIEEIEAHLHPQAQLQIIDALQNKTTYPGQLILTTHSTTLASKVKLEHIILCKDNSVYPMGVGFTKLSRGDYEFLERFLDDTKANLFFARGVIFVEGDAENLLIPTISEILDRPLHKYGVSIVNVGNTAFLRYSRIFMRKDKKEFNIPISIVTDLDIQQVRLSNGDIVAKEVNKKIPDIETEKAKKNILGKGGNNISVYISPLWTMEYDILNSFNITRELLFASILEAQLIKNKGANYIGLNDKEIQRKRKIAYDSLKKWSDEGKTNKWIAFNIYNKYLNNSNNKISKAVTAQQFARKLKEEITSVKEIILKSSEFEYLRNAIYNVTKAN